MATKSFSDRLTVIAIAVIAYAGVNINHEIIGHCGMAALLDAGCSYISTTDIRPAVELFTWKYRIVAFAGSAMNWLVAFICLGLLRSARQNSSQAWRYFLWLSLCVNLFVPSMYLLFSPAIAFGDWYLIVVDFPHSLVWRGALVTAGAAACLFSFWLCRAELRRLNVHQGEGAWALVVPAYVAGGIVTVASGLLSPLTAKWAQIQAAGATFGFTFWLLLLPLVIPETLAQTEQPFMVPRSVGWIVAGALVALAFVGVLGRGFAL